ARIKSSKEQAAGGRSSQGFRPQQELPAKDLAKIALLFFRSPKFKIHQLSLSNGPEPDIAVLNSRRNFLHRASPALIERARQSQQQYSFRQCRAIADPELLKK